jgi:type III restriction enzyme
LSCSWALADEKNPRRFIITVQKLREGWDCPFAYILCSLANVGATVAVEQMLGRVLRMPYARRRSVEELNSAYAYVVSPNFAQAAKALTDAIVDSGFDRFEAKSMVLAEPEPVLDLSGAGPLYAPEYAEPVSEPPKLDALPKPLAQRLSIEGGGGATELVYRGEPLTQEDAQKIKALCTTDADRLAVEKIRRRSQGESVAPVVLGQKLRVPCLAVQIDGQWEMLEDQPKDVAWSLREQDATLGESAFTLPSDEQQVAQIDVKDKSGEISLSFLREMDKQLLLLDIHAPKTPSELAVWLDRRIEHPSITQVESVAFLRKLIDYLISERGMSIEQLVTHRHQLQLAAEAKIKAHQLHAEQTAFNSLIADRQRVRATLEDVTFSFPLMYPAKDLYKGPIEFQKHFYPVVAAMNGEEAQCAAAIDNLPSVEYWVRNLEQRSEAFWLPLPSGRKFYPDFVANLIGEKLLVVEYKGAHLETGEDAQEKRHIGELWEAVSEHDGIFRMVGKHDYEVILKSVG